MNMPNPSQLVVIGIAIVFGVPIIAGIVIGHFFGFGTGLFAGVVLCALILAIAHRRTARQGKDKEQ